MNKSSLLASVLCAAAPLALVLPGCGGGSGGPNPAATATPTATVTATATATETATSTPTPTTTVTFGPVREYYVKVAFARVTEGNAGQKMMEFVVSGYDTYIKGFPLSFSYRTLDGTAVAGEDYLATSGQSSVTTGSTTTISVPIIGDTVPEADEVFTFQIFNAQGRYKVTNQSGTIVDDDTPPQPTATPTQITGT